MMTHLLRLIGIVYLCGFYAQRALADSEQSREATVGFSVLHFEYEEFADNGNLLDRESGTLPGFIFNLEQRGGPWVFGGTFSYHAGDITYDGQTQSAIPVRTQTDQQLVAFDARGEYWSDVEKRWAVYGGIGYRYWSRDIQPTRTSSGSAVSGLYEVYQWWPVFLGTKALLYQRESTRWLLDARIFRVLAPEVRVNATSQFDETTLDLGERNGLRLSAPWRHDFDKVTQINIEPYVEAWEFGRSATLPATQNGLVVGTIFEPRSETRTYGINFGFSRRF